MSSFSTLGSFLLAPFLSFSSSRRLTRLRPINRLLSRLRASTYTIRFSPEFLLVQEKSFRLAEVVHKTIRYNFGICYCFFRFRSLLALLFHHMEIGQRLDGGCGDDRELGLKATSLYLVLLAIPGSTAFKIFHPVLYNKALDTFKLALKLHLVSKNT